jgi:hypothetical protein
MCGLLAYRHSDGGGEQVAAWMGFDLLEGAYDTRQCIRVLDGLGHQLGHQPVLHICRRTRRSWILSRGCGPTSKAASWPTAAAPTAPR